MQQNCRRRPLFKASYYRFSSFKRFKCSFVLSLTAGSEVWSNKAEVLCLPKDWRCQQLCLFLGGSGRIHAQTDAGDWKAPIQKLTPVWFFFSGYQGRGLTLVAPLPHRKLAEEHLCTLLQLFFSDSFSPPKLCLRSAPAQDHTHPGNFPCSYKIIYRYFFLHWVGMALDPM